MKKGNKSNSQYGEPWYQPKRNPNKTCLFNEKTTDTLLRAFHIYKGIIAKKPNFWVRSNIKCQCLS